MQDGVEIAMVVIGGDVNELGAFGLERLDFFMIAVSSVFGGHNKDLRFRSGFKKFAIKGHPKIGIEYDAQRFFAFGGPGGKLGIIGDDGIDADKYGLG